MQIIVGLGNPGDQYKNTRHNLGFMVLDEYLRKIDGGRWKMGGEDRGWKLDKRFKSEIVKINNDILLVKPQTYMNNSGQSIAVIAKYFKVNPEEVVIIHDDLDLPLGKMKIRIGGSGGGHHGVESVIDHLKTDKFIRIKLGIEPLQGSGHAVLSEHRKDHFEPEHFVLEEFMPNEKSKVKHMAKRAIEALDLLLEEGLEVAQNQYNQ